MLLQVAVEFAELRLQSIEFLIDVSQRQYRLRRQIRKFVDLAAAAIDIP